MSETLEILYQDDCLVAVNKPSGLLVHRSPIDRHETRFAVQILRNQIGQYVYPAHRLDKGTSGVLLFALNPATLTAISQQFEQRRVHKRYLAVVRGHPPESGEIDHPLVFLRDQYEKGASREGEAQDALTGYRRLAITELPFAIPPYPSSRYAQVELFPQTGRRHQIRRHLKHIAHPIIGDATYGKGVHNRAFAEAFGVSRLLLHCAEMQLQHPLTQRALPLSAPLDPAMQQVLKASGLMAEGLY